MPASRRDYILTLIDQLGELLAQAIAKRKKTPLTGTAQAHQALQSVIQSCERLFGLEGAQLFQFTPDQHIAMLADGEAPEVARDKILLYSALCAEAGEVYATLGKPAVAQQSRLNALRLTLRARSEFPGGDLPLFAVEPAELLAALKGVPLDPETKQLVDRYSPP